MSWFIPLLCAQAQVEILPVYPEKASVRGGYAVMSAGRRDRTSALQVLLYGSAISMIVFQAEFRILGSSPCMSYMHLSHIYLL